jgi:tRNA pseudouridine38-40 synthase
MRTFKLTLSYDGGAYSGWQFQPGRATLQGTLEKAIEATVGARVSTVASGRTDAGVHALGQVVSFACDSQLSVEVLQRALNARLPRDMGVCALDEVASGFHAIRDAIRKRYRYVLRDGAAPNVFERKYAWQLPPRLDVDAMQRAAQRLVGTHDFKSFESSGAERQSSVRTVYELTVRRQVEQDPDRIVLEIAANGFLYNMVRAIVGTLVPVGRGARSEAWPAEALAACDRRAAGGTAPPHGLFLVDVDYGPAGAAVASSATAADVAACDIFPSTVA